MQQNLISWQCLMESREFSLVFCCFVVLLFCGWVSGGYYYHQSALLANELAWMRRFLERFIGVSPVPFS